MNLEAWDQLRVTCESVEFSKKRSENYYFRLHGFLLPVFTGSENCQS